MPPCGANEGEAIEASEGDDSACRNECCPSEGVGGTRSVPVKDLLNVGV